MIYGGNYEYDLLPVIPMDPVKHPSAHWSLQAKIRINCILRTDKDYVEQWIRAIAKGISVSPGPNIMET